jgi:hypothetical protein
MQSLLSPSGTYSRERRFEEGNMTVLQTASTEPTGLLSTALTELRRHGGQFILSVGRREERYLLRIEDDRGWQIELAFCGDKTPPEVVSGRIRQALALRSWPDGAPRVGRWRAVAGLVGAAIRGVRP